MKTVISKGEMEEVGRAFGKAHGERAPTHLSRAPGRVNLIGEHTDYNDLPVFPMALRQEIRIFFSLRNDQRVRIVNLDDEFPPRSFNLSPNIPREEVGDWGNYLKAPCQALAERLGSLRGFDALVVSTLPVASGLSSSSALVNAVGLALLHTNDISIPTLELAEEMARGERYTGTQGGGMDQAISLGAREGHASRIEFNPLSLHPTRVPPAWRFVVAHTMVRAEKSGGAQEAYNRRRAECAEALRTLNGVVDTQGKGPLGYRDLMAMMPVGELLELAAGKLSSPLLQRFRHVVTEAVRVYGAEEAMGKEDLLTFGILMDASHESLRTDYEVSSRELDELVELARAGGGAGARLTGAGFGGCMVALTTEAKAPEVMESLARGYYAPRGVSGDLKDVLFLAEPGPGASVGSL